MAAPKIDSLAAATDRGKVHKRPDTLETGSFAAVALWTESGKLSGANIGFRRRRIGLL
jgi:hypothetical protein